MDQAPRRPPWLSRLSPGLWTVGTWCAAGAFAVLLLGTTLNVKPPQFPHQGHGPFPVLAAAFLLAAPVCAAHRRPTTVFWLLLAESAVAAALLPRAWPFFLAAEALLPYLAATRPRPGVVAAVAAPVVWIAEWAVFAVGADRGLSDAASTAAAVAVTSGLAWLIGDSARRRREYGEAVKAQTTAQAVTAERLRIARELHDLVAHSIGVIALQAGAAGMVLDSRPDGARAALTAIEETSRQTLTGLRRMLVSLRQAEQDSAAAAPAAGLAAVPDLAETVAGAGLTVDVCWLGTRRPLPPEVDLAAFRIIQEAVTNVVRHAGASRCRVRVEFRGEELVVEVTDEGRAGGRGSLGPPGPGFGIAGMRERAALLGGGFSAGPLPGGGFRVAARLPG